MRARRTEEDPMQIKKTTIALTLAAAFGIAPALAQNPAPSIPRLDHVFVIVMENHHYGQIFGNSNAPFVNAYAKSANLAANYFGVGHPSLTNYLEMVGGSNFGVVNDNSPDWHNKACRSNLELNTPALEGAPNICPIAGSGMDAATPAVDTTNEGTPAARFTTTRSPRRTPWARPSPISWSKRASLGRATRRACRRTGPTGSTTATE